MRGVRGLAASRDRNPFRRPKFGNETVALEASSGWSREKQIAPHIPVIDKSTREDGTFSRVNRMAELRNLRT